MGGVVVPSAILVVSVAIPSHAMFIRTLIGNDCWGSLTGVRNGSVLTGGLARGLFDGVSISLVDWLVLSWGICLFGFLVSW
jgi:hypothetical protein